MSLYVFLNTGRRPSKDTGIVRDHITVIRRGRELPVAMSSRRRGSLLWRALAANGRPVPRPAGLKVAKARPPRTPLWLRRAARRLIGRP